MSPGVKASVSASVIFGCIYFYVQLLTFLDSNAGFGWRVLLALPFITLLLWYLGELKLIGDVIARVKKTPWLIAGLLLSAFLCGVQVWLFTWGAFANRGLAVSLGYFLLPIVMVIVGRFLYRDQLSRLQKIATALCVLAVGYALLLAGELAWETLLVAFGYPAYFVVRKELDLNHLGGFWWDMVLGIPVYVYFIAPTLGHINVQEFALIAGFGALSALGLCAYILANKLLNFSIFGLLSYLEPLLLALASIAVGEVIGAESWPTYGLIWCAVVLLIWDGVLQQRRSTRKD